MSYFRKPKMVLFDVGGTLFNDGVCNPPAGLTPLREAALNPSATDVQTMTALWNRAMKELDVGNKSRSGYTVEIPLPCVLKYVSMHAGLKYAISSAEQEEIFDRFNSTRSLTPGITRLLARLDEAGIRTAVISNNMMTGEGLALTIAHWIPEAKMEFILTSADLLLAKPSSDLFTAAAAYAGLDPSECWYCGDGRIPDVDGAKNGGMSPVLYDAASTVASELREDGGRGEYLAVNSWDVLGDLICKL